MIPKFQRLVSGAGPCEVDRYILEPKKAGWCAGEQRYRPDLHLYRHLYRRYLEVPRDWKGWARSEPVHGTDSGPRTVFLEERGKDRPIPFWEPSLQRTDESALKERAPSGSVRMVNDLPGLLTGDYRSP